MNRLRNLVRSKSSNSGDLPTNGTIQNGTATANGSGDSPEADVARGVRLFCESGGPNNTSAYIDTWLTIQRGEEVLHLPVIVDAAESSPAAAKEAANVIRKFLSAKNFNRAYVQYNAIMLLRILADNPGPTFTRNLDGKFIQTTKDLLRDGRDMSVQQILRETLDTFELQRAQDETLQPLIQMWQNEKSKWAKRTGNDISSAVMQNHRNAAPPFTPGQQAHFHPGMNHPQHHRDHHSHFGRLPPPHELASRIEEARTSGKLLTQVVQSTPQNEVLSNDLIREFAERCREASRSIQGYINADNPPPDEETLTTLIETNDGLAAALSKHQHALLKARKAAAGSPPPPQQRDIAGSGRNTATNAIDQGRTSTPPVPRAGPAPILSMPKLPTRPENPFSDANQTEPPVEDRSRANVVSPYESSGMSAMSHGQHPDVSEDEESPQAPRQYRF